MSPRKWPSVLAIVAFVLSLAHSSIPHTHPEHGKEKKSHGHLHNSKRGQHGHSHNTESNHHHSHANDHAREGNEKSDDDLPVFSHFSNADYLGNSYYKFKAKENFATELILPEVLIVEIPVSLEKPLLFPRARDLPSRRHKSAESLRAPPFLS